MRNRDPMRDIRAGHGAGLRRVRDKYDGTISNTPIDPLPTGDNFLFIDGESFLVDGDGAPFFWRP